MATKTISPSDLKSSLEVSDFPDSLDTTPEVTTDVTDKSATTDTYSTTTAPQVDKPTAGLISYDEQCPVDQSTIKIGTLSRVETNITSYSATPMQLAAVKENTVSIELMVEQIKKYFDNYIRHNTSMIKPFEFPSQAKASIEAFLSMVHYAVSNPVPAVLNEVFVFFKNNRKGILDPLYALQGIHELKKEDSMLAQIFYQVFYSSTDPNSKGLNMEVARDVFGKNGDAIVNFITLKR